MGENNKTNGGSNRFVNGDKEGYNDSNQKIGGVSDLSGNNSNPNLYTIYITSFNDTTYAIGDPRSTTPYNFNGALKATNYKATQKTGDVKQVINPAFKVASSWGKTSSLNYDRALQRCAAYQENGYPAGRWRIPTKAEVEFIVGLSQAGKIPRLFGQENSTTDYWVSSGYYNTKNGYTEKTDGTRYVRCVYDVWYWGDEKISNPNVFTWRDN